MNDPTLRELRDAEDAVAALTSYIDSLRACGFDRGYALSDKLNVYRAVARLCGSDEVAEYASNIERELTPFDAVAHYRDMAIKARLEPVW